MPNPEPAFRGRGVALAKTVELARGNRMQTQAARTTSDCWPTTGRDETATIPLMSRSTTVSDADPLAGAWRLSLCGFTRSEMLGFRWDDLDLNAGESSVSRGRTPLDGGCSTVNDPKSDQRCRTPPMRPCAAAGVPRIKLHNVRHSLAQLLLAQGYPPDVAAEVIGHISQVFIERYVRQSPRERITEYARPLTGAA